MFQKIEEESNGLNGTQLLSNQSTQADSALVNGSHNEGQDDLIAIDISDAVSESNKVRFTIHTKVSSWVQRNCGSDLS